MTYFKPFSFYQKINTSKTLLLMSMAAALMITFGWFYFTTRYSVNILFYDAWDFHRLFIHHNSIFEQFTSQFGPQRQGLGLVITGFLNEFSGWNSNWISFAVSVLIFMSVAVYLMIRFRLFGRFQPFDLIIVIVVLSLNQYEVLVITPFISHSAIPALLVSFFCLTLFIRSVYLRNLVLLFINLNLVYSGFGFFMGPVFMMLLLIEMYQDFKEGDKHRLMIDIVTLVVALATQLSFFIGYDTGYARDHVKILWSKPWMYLYYISLTYAGFFGLKGTGYPQIIFGMILLGGVVFVVMKSFTSLLFTKKTRDEHSLLLNKIMLVLTSYSLLFAVNLAFGRLELGLEFAGSSRYLPYIVPSVIGIYFYLNSLKFSLKSILVPVFFALIMLVQYSSMRSINDIRIWSKWKSDWKMNYLKFENPDIADSLSNFQVYPNNANIQDVLKYLKENHLNLYLDIDYQKDNACKAK